MTRSPNIHQAEYEAANPVAVFIDLYNKSLPTGYPAASAAKLEKFRNAYPQLFKAGANLWSIDKHRKRVMDWLSSHENS